MSFVWILNSLMTFILPGYYLLRCLFTEIWFSFIVDLPVDISVTWKNIRTIVVDIWPVKPLLYTSIYKYEYKLINVSLTIYVLICNVVRNPFFCIGKFVVLGKYTIKILRSIIYPICYNFGFKRVRRLSSLENCQAFARSSSGFFRTNYLGWIRHEGRPLVALSRPFHWRPPLSAVNKQMLPICWEL